MDTITNDQIRELAKEAGYEYAMLKAFIEVESGGIGFDRTTGKIIIQFEPAWFKRKSPYTPSGKWSLNGVERQSKEWEAFNDAFRKDPNAAMESTSIGLMQVMGFHWKSLRFSSVGEMWDFAKRSEKNQVKLALLFIKNNPKLDKAIKEKDFNTIAYYYNGQAYRKFNYHTRMRAAYRKFA